MVTKLCIFGIILIMLFVYVSKFSIKLNPFLITCPRWGEGIGIVLIILGIWIFTSFYGSRRYSEGEDKAYDIFIKTIEENINK